MKRLSTLACLIVLAAQFCAAKTVKTAWSPAGDRIMSEWAEKIDPSAPLPEYPRPQMVRSEWVNLNGLWNYAITPAEATSFTAEGEILVPFCVESALSGVGRKVSQNDALWYSRTFTVPKAWKGRNVLLHFGAIDWASEIWVNGKSVCKHTGGYTPITVDITPYLTSSKTQTLQVKVLDATDQSYQPRGKQWEVPSGIWYTPVTGIWQTVWMEPVAKAHIDNYYVVSDIDNCKMDVSIDAASEAGDSFVVEVIEGARGYSAEAPGSAVVASATVSAGEHAVMDIADMHTWSYADPYLYGIKISQVRNGKVIDVVNGYTAMRKVSLINKRDDGKRLGINNEAEFMFGPLDQGWWPDGLYTAPSDEALHYDIKKTRDFGYNMIRKHIKIEPARWYYWADVEGIYLWQDMPSIGDHGHPAHRDKEVADRTRNRWANLASVGGTDCDIPQEWKDNYYKEWGEIIASIKNFQCIVVWVPFNEAWAQFDTPQVVDFTRAQDNTRLINPSSGGNFCQNGDILDIHQYPGPHMVYYEMKFANVFGEFGGIGYPIQGHLWQDRNWGYVSFESAEDVFKKYSELIEEMKAFVRIGYCGAVYTQTTDVEGEVNGLMTYDRKVIKMDEKKLFEVNQSLISSMPK